MLLMLLLLQWPVDHDLLAVEDARNEPAALIEALDGPHAAQAMRALGRFERPELAPSIARFLSSEDADLRIEAVTALAQMKAATALSPLLESERDSRVRAVLYESIGRLPEGMEETLLAGLSEDEPARRGAMKGLEALYRTREMKPTPSALAAIRKTVRESRSSPVRQLGLLALNRAGDRDRETLESAFRDTDPQVRRLAIAGLKEWREDPSPLVRYEALRVDGSCVRAEASLGDPSEHVALLAIDLLGNGCAPASLERIVTENRGWRPPAHALVSLSKVSKEAARRALPRFVSHPVWQARTYAAKAARELDDEAALEKLRSDSHPNVIAEALRTPEEALEALAKDDYGLLMTALEMLKGRTSASAAPILLETLARVSARKEATSRDPRRLLLERLREIENVEGDGLEEKLDFLLSDFDPAIAAFAAAILTEKTGRKVEPRSKRFPPDPLPSRDFILALQGARAKIQMKEAGSFIIEILPDVAPLTAARFAKLAESGYYRGLTFHRIVPNFVIQGGSPGANEYVGTPGYLRDEVSNLSHLRGTLGISTRGRDTGDSQIFVNLVDNYRLDHNYTVFARVIEGMENVDSIQEGDVFEHIVIERR
ncbi:MAG TPA: peptidylprolyl isomerase [Vicinamibacteria bacterium]|nr:peptidylprolyl isomerase [Vicinamibacteria bacterium]